MLAAIGKTRLQAKSPTKPGLPHRPESVDPRELALEIRPFDRVRFVVDVPGSDAPDTVWRGAKRGEVGNVTDVFFSPKVWYIVEVHDEERPGWTRSLIEALPEHIELVERERY